MARKRRAQRKHRSQPQRNITGKRPFRFLDLPAEIRNMVYGYLVVSPSSIHPHLPDQLTRGHTNPINTALLAASRQINQEPTAVFNLKNVGTICNRHHLWLERRECTSAALISRGPNHWDLDKQDMRLDREVRSLAAGDHKWQRLLRTETFKDDMFWVMISRLHRVLIKVNWIDTRRVRTYIHHRCIWVSYERPLLYMLRPFRDLVMEGEANMLNTIVISFR